MKHKKIHHAMRINNCWNNAGGKCEFGEEESWFSHSIENGTDREKTFECNNCDETFDVKAKLLYHRKKHHLESVQTCRNNPCKYDSKSCWFNHDTNGNDNENN